MKSEAQVMHWRGSLINSTMPVPCLKIEPKDYYLKNIDLIRLYQNIGFIRLNLDGGPPSQFS